MIRAAASTLALPLALALAAAVPARAQEPGDFDYYVLALSWSPNWCALEGGPEEEQCDPDAGFGWILHGLWPQYEEGWPSWCEAGFDDPSRAEAEAMADIAGSAGLARHAWRKHGSCSGLSPRDYFALSREAVGAVAIPPGFAALSRTEAVPAAAVEAAFLRANPALGPDGITVTCRDGHLQEVRICLTRDLDPRPCGADVRRDCRLPDALIEPIP